RREARPHFCRHPRSFLSGGGTTAGRARTERKLRGATGGRMEPTTAQFPPIAVVDVRDGGPVRHARERAAGAGALPEAWLAWFPPAVVPLLPFLDRRARRWLTRSRAPYVADIEAIAAVLGFPGIWLLNASYQWGCTALAREEGGAPWLARTLDWPFPGL